MQSKVIQYVAEEVRRQGHDITRLDGIQRTAWMLGAWCEAARLYLRHQHPTIENMKLVAALIEPDMNQKGFRKVNVYVGPKAMPDPDSIERLVELLWGQIDKLTPMEFYKHFEEIHPFIDGNGRTGKIILNWLNNTLYDPVFPPIDMWGRPIVNP